jgi:hypothetical protein
MPAGNNRERLDSVLLGGTVLRTYAIAQNPSIFSSKMKIVMVEGLATEDWACNCEIE